MNEIKIMEPLFVQIEIKEYDSIQNSIKLYLSLQDESMKGKFQIQTNFWVFCQDYDLFAMDESKEIIDFSGQKRISIETNKLIIYPSYINPSMKFECKIEIENSEELISTLRVKMNDFPKWW